MVFSIPQLLIVLLITALLFGTKKLRNIGSDLGNALKGFKNAMREDEPKTADTETNNLQGQTVDDASPQSTAQSKKGGEQV